MVKVAALLNSKALQLRIPFASRISSTIINRKKESEVLGTVSLFRALCNTERSSMTTSNPETFDLDEFPKPIQINGRFVIPWTNNQRPSFYEAFKTFTFGETKNGSNIPSQEQLDRVPQMEILKPAKEILENPQSDGVQVTWLGHASTLVQFDGISVLTDPVFSDYCGMYQMRPFGTKRYRKCPVQVDDLPEIDAVVLSHDHYDHLDLNTVKNLNSRYGDKLRWYVPLGFEKWMNATGCNNVVELNWWDEHEFSSSSFNTNNPTSASSADSSASVVKFVFTPAQHWCMRNGFDENKRLFGSWVIMGPHNRFYFAGDTGYCDMFKSIGKRYGPFDLAAIPIGAYCPRDFMKFQHVNPEDAVLVHKDIKARKSVAIHWGTFNLSFEPFLEPPQLLKDNLEKQGIPLEDFICIRHGETVKFSKENQISN